MEFVFVVPRHRLFPSYFPQGFAPFGRAIDQHEFDTRLRTHGYFVEREYAEQEPALKQVIPYCIVVRDGRVLLLRRQRAGSETRLHDKLSIGVGGHVNPVDLPEPPLPAHDAGAAEAERGRPSPIPRALQRELNEELALAGAYEARPIGVINDDSNAVGAVHVGYVQVVTVEGDVQVREKDRLEGEFVEISRLRDLLVEGADFETWSSILVEHLDEIFDYARAACS